MIRWEGYYGGGYKRSIIVKTSASSVFVAGYFRGTLSIDGLTQTASGGTDLYVLSIDKKYGVVSWLTSKFRLASGARKVSLLAGN